MSQQKFSLDSEIDLGIDPGRVLFGLSRIGYNPPSALCDIIDNSVRFDAKNIRILIVKEQEEVSDSRKNNVKQYLVIDDGKGMSNEAMQEALKLGSSEQEYERNSLSKFELGLKSAAFSQGEELHEVQPKFNLISNVRYSDRASNWLIQEYAIQIAQHFQSNYYLI